MWCGRFIINHTSYNQEQINRQINPDNLSEEMEKYSPGNGGAADSPPSVAGESNRESKVEKEEEQF